MKNSMVVVGLYDDKPNFSDLFASASGHQSVALFDLDGTLVDSAPDICYSINDVMDTIGFPFVSEEYVRRWVGGGTKFLLEKILEECALSHWATNAQKNLRNAYNLFLSSYRNTNCRFARLYPYVRESFSALTNRNFKIGIVTNRPHEFTGPLISCFGMENFVDTVVSGDEFGSFKPCPDMLLYALAELGGSPESSIMIGDSFSDVMAAKNAGIMSVYVRYGYGIDALRGELYADCSIDSLRELV